MIIDYPRYYHMRYLVELWYEAFADSDDYIRNFFTKGYAWYNSCTIRENDLPVAALYWFDCHWQGKTLAYVYGVATAKSHRGQGLCHQLMEGLNYHLQKRYYDGVVLVPAKPELFGLYEGMGYRPFGGMDSRHFLPAETPVPLKQLTWQEYDDARQAYLTEDCVRHGPLMMHYLGTFAQFYEGPDFITCVCVEDGKVTGYELLGNADAAPGILKALGAREGTFRFRGETPFAMYRSFKDDDQMPGYFAFALD